MPLCRRPEPARCVRRLWQTEQWLSRWLFLCRYDYAIPVRHIVSHHLPYRLPPQHTHPHTAYTTHHITAAAPLAAATGSIALIALTAHDHALHASSPRAHPRTPPRAAPTASCLPHDRPRLPSSLPHPASAMHPPPAHAPPATRTRRLIALAHGKGVFKRHKQHVTSMVT